MVNTTSGQLTMGVSPVGYVCLRQKGGLMLADPSGELASTQPSQRGAGGRLHRDHVGWAGRAIRQQREREQWGCGCVS
jgi:hypothetical protein